jgi:hypothetical protein
VPRSNAGKFTGKKRVEIAAKNGFFHERGHEYRHGHQEHGPVAVFE